MKRNTLTLIGNHEANIFCHGYFVCCSFYAFSPYYFLLAACPFDRLYALKPKNPE